jgi:hypothetical protein
MEKNADWDTIYIDGIRQAHENGLIESVRASEYLGPRDKFAHFPKHGTDYFFNGANTRRLMPTARSVLRSLSKIDDLHFLELGAGSGFATNQVRDALPDARIETVSQTPINPLLRLNSFIDFNGIMNFFLRKYAGIMSDGQQVDESSLPPVMQMKDGVLHGPEMISAEHLNYLAKSITGSSAFTATKNPVADKQYIGSVDSLRSEGKSPQAATFVYDNMGAFTYGLDFSTFSWFAKLVRPDGMFITSLTSYNMLIDMFVIQGNFKVIETKTNTVFVGPDHEFSRLDGSDREHFDEFLKSAQKRELFGA